MTQRPAQIALTNYKLGDYANRLRQLAQVMRMGGDGVQIEPSELEEIAAVLEGQMYSPLGGTGQ